MVYACMFCGRIPDSSGNLTLHKFPSDEESSKKWLKQMGLPQLQICKTMRLCSQHFAASALKKNKNYTTVVNGAVPTIFNGEYKNSCVYCKEKKGASNRLFHRFPLHDETLTAQWLTNMDMKDFYPTSHSLLCSSHFEESCYRPNTGRSGVRIRLKAIPTIFSGFPGGSLELDNLQDTDVDVACESVMEVDAIKQDDNGVASLEDHPSAPMAPEAANDHRYTCSLISLRKSLDRVKKKLILERYESKKKNQKIKRLQNKVAALKDIVKELRQRKTFAVLQETKLS